MKPKHSYHTRYHLLQCKKMSQNWVYYWQKVQREHKGGAKNIFVVHFLLQLPLLLLISSQTSSHMILLFLVLFGNYDSLSTTFSHILVSICFWFTGIHFQDDFRFYYFNLEIVEHRIQLQVYVWIGRAFGKR